MSGRRSRNKGARGEREIVQKLAEHGIKSYRTPNSGGLAIKSDIQGWGDFSPEVKFQETSSIWAWWEQACNSASAHQTPLVIFRRSRSEWLVTMSFDDFLGLMYHAQEEDDESAT